MYIYPVTRYKRTGTRFFWGGHGFFQRISIHVFMYPFFCEYRCMQKWVDLRQWIHFEYIFASLKNRKSFKNRNHTCGTSVGFSGRFDDIDVSVDLTGSPAWLGRLWMDADLSSLPTDANALATEARRVCSSLLRPSHHLFVICIGHWLAGY